MAEKKSICVVTALPDFTVQLIVSLTRGVIPKKSPFHAVTAQELLSDKILGNITSSRMECALRTAFAEFVERAFSTSHNAIITRSCFITRQRYLVLIIVGGCFEEGKRRRSMQQEFMAMEKKVEKSQLFVATIVL